MAGIQDAIALHKSTFITKNSSLNLDVSAEGFGMIVDKFDKDGWIKSVILLLDDEHMWNKIVIDAENSFQTKI